MRLSVVLLIFALIVGCEGEKKGSKPSNDAIGKCYINKTSGVLVGRVVAIVEHPTYKVWSYQVERHDLPGSFFYMSIDNAVIQDCEGAQEKQQMADDLLGKCAYNPSDMKYIGRVIRVGPEGSDASGKSAPGQRAVVINTPENEWVTVTYPKYLVVKECK